MIAVWFAVLFTWTVLLVLWTVHIFRSRMGTKYDVVQDIVDLKAELEQLRSWREYQKKLEDEKTNRLTETVTNIYKLFEELKTRTEMTESEREKRVKQLVDQIKIFLEQQQKHVEMFLIEQGKSKEEIEKRRDAQLQDVKRTIEEFVKTISGTRTRGRTGENILKEVMKESIKVGIVKTNLKTGNGEVEFAWDLGDGKYIPIDSKLPELEEIIEQLEKADISEKESYRKLISDKLKKEIERVKKYQNCHNTIDSCILVVPDAALDIAPELMNIGRESNVYLCGYKDVFFVAHTIAERYLQLKEQGDVGRYKQLVNGLLKVLAEIEKKIDSIAKSSDSIRSSVDKIRENIAKAKRFEDFQETLEKQNVEES